MHCSETELGEGYFQGSGKCHPVNVHFNGDGLKQKRHNSIANTLELHLSCINPLIYHIYLLSCHYLLSFPSFNFPLWISFYWGTIVSLLLFPELYHCIWGLCCQKQVSQAEISNYIPQFTVGCSYLSLPEIPASGSKVHIFVYKLLIVLKDIHSFLRIAASFANSYTHTYILHTESMSTVKSLI